MTVNKLVLGLHDLNAWGGQERSNLEIFYRINNHIPIELHSYTFADNRTWKDLKHIPYTKRFTHPILLKIHHYQLESFLKLQKNYPVFSGRRNKGTLIQSTGTALPYSDVVQVQFIHKAWQKTLLQLPSHSQPSSLLDISYASLTSTANLLHEKALYNNRKKYVAISHSVKKDLMSYFNIDRNNIEVIYHGVAADDFPSRFDAASRFARKQIRHEHNISDDAIVLLTVGALNTRKGLHVILETARELITNGIDNIIVLAVGAGQTDAFNKKSMEWGIHKYVRLVSAQKDIAPYYQASDIFFFPSLYEPFGLVILEAMASGLAVVTSSISGAAELLTPGRDGIIINPFGSAQDIASEISLLIKDTSKMESFGRRARETAQFHNWDAVAKNYLNFYQAL